MRVDVDTTLISGKPEIQLEVDRQIYADFGVRVGDPSQAFKNARRWAGSNVLITPGQSSMRLGKGQSTLFEQAWRGLNE